MNALRSAGYWSAAPLVCLILQWRSFQAWFRADDFAWLGVGRNIHSFRDFLEACFMPLAQGTIRPWSERLFFIAGFAAFGMDSLPFRIVIFATHFANLILVASIGARLTGKRVAGLVAALIWAVHSSATDPLGWACVYNQVLCAFFLLLAFHFLLRLVETGRRRFEIYMWIAFVLGFGAQELNLVFPALATAYTFWCARKYWLRTLPMFAVSAAYFAIHLAATPLQRSGEYVMHFNGSMFRTLARYWTWSAGPFLLWTPWGLPRWAVMIGIYVVSAGLFVFLFRRWRGPALFFAAWYLIAIAPVLPLRDHPMQYYVYIPVIGVCWLGGWAMVEAWKAGWHARTAAVAAAAIYILLMAPRTVAAANWNYELTQRVRNLVESAAGALELHPNKFILLEGLGADLFRNAILDHPFRVLGPERVYLTPGSERQIPAHMGDAVEFVLPADVARRAWQRGELVVYDAQGPQLINITANYGAKLRDAGIPRRVDLTNPLVDYLLGPEWYPGGKGQHRWMPKRATLRIGAPTVRGQQLEIYGTCPPEHLRAGPLGVTVRVDGNALPPAVIESALNGFVLSFPLPDSVVGQREMAVTVEVSRTFRPASDPQDLGLALGSFTVK